MKNLELFEISRETIKGSYNNVSRVAFTKECVYALHSSHLSVYNRNSGEILHTFEEQFRCITDLEILTIENILWFGTGVEFVYVNIDNNELHKIELYDSFLAAAWNPAQDSIAIVATNGSIGVYRIDYEDDLIIPIEITQLSSIISKEEFINLGWGSINTQFRGTAGKLSSVVQESDEAIAIQGCPYPQISWRGNGEMFVIININEIMESKFLVFQYPCALIHQSVPVLGLRPVIAWSPEGNKIASFVWTKKKCELTIFEKNGLFRSSFELFRKEKVVEIKWNPSGNILAIRQEDDKGLTTIDIYYVKNYVWYLKQRLNFECNALTQYEFLSLTSVCSLRVTTKSESVTYTFKFVVSNSCKSYNDEGLVCASINANELYLTNCKEGVKPPPMCDFVAKMNVPINFVLFHPDQPKLAIVDCDNWVKIFEIQNNNLKSLGEFQLKYDSKLGIPLKFHHFVWKSDTQILCISEGNDNNECSSSLFVLKLTDEWQFVKEAEIEKDVSYIEYIESSDTLLLQKCNVLSQVVGGVTEDGIILPSLVLYRKSIVIDDELYIFSLTSADKFYVNLEEVLGGEGVISFIIHDGYLLLTTLRHNLMCIRLNKQSIFEFTQQKFENVYSRSIEQGSYLLFGIPDTSYIVMQMPRGNVEMCACRMISMDRIESLIQDQKWDLALDLVRIEKLSTNILVDLDVDRFVSDVPQFVKSVQIPSIINDFLLGLQEENVLITLYKNCSIAQPKQVTNKLEVIGNAMIDFMTNYNYFYYISTIVIACFIKNSTTSIEDALQHIQNLLHSNSIKVAEEAFKSIYTLKPNARIYQKALEMYDLDLAMFVAKHIQMDPKEYKPFINNLKNLDSIRCRFEINTSLKHYDMAVKYLIRYSEDKNEILGFIKEHSVYKSAYECLDLNSSLLNDVTKIYAEELSKQRLYDEAATLYERAGLNKLALEEYKKALLWEQAIVIMKREEVHVTEFNEHLYEIINNLKKQRRIPEACEIYEKYLEDYETSIVLLAENKLFSQALNLVKKYKRNDIYESDIALALKEYCSDLCSKFQCMHETFMKYKERLSVVRSKKVEKLTSAMHYDNRLNSQQPNYEDDICSIADTVASTTSTRSTSSRSSTMSSRHRRKEERKKEDLREGGFYEDIALMKALHQLVQEAFQLGPQIRQLCLSIISYGQNVTIDIKGMHNLLVKLQDDMKFGIKEIWPLNINNVKAIEDPNASIIYANVDVLDVKYRSPPEGLNTFWKLTLI